MAAAVAAWCAGRALAQDLPTADATSALPGDGTTPPDVRTFFETYCFKCHSGEKIKGDTRLDAVTTGTLPHEVMWDVRMALEDREMPPRSELQPEETARSAVLAWLTEQISGDEQKPIDPGWFTIHRLNRAEYRNTVRDLLGVDPAKVDIAGKLPRDDTGYGFDNMADVLTISPLAMEAYLDAAEKAVEEGLGKELVIGDVPRDITPIEGEGSGTALGAGGYFMYSQGSAGGNFNFPASGEYMIRIGAWETHGGDENARLSLRLDGKEISSFGISGTQSVPEAVETQVKVSRGMHRITAHFTNDYYVAKVADRNLAVEWITVAGPLRAETTERPDGWARVLGGDTGSGDRDAARAVVTRFAGKAFRRTVGEDDLAPLMKVYDDERARGRSRERAIRSCLETVLVSPAFLYRSVQSGSMGEQGTVHVLSGDELASRLSYFLWSSMPDEALRAAAQDGSLQGDEVLRAQVRRMLADTKADALVENFAGQWLQLRSLDGLAIDRGRFPAYTDDLKKAMVLEARMYFGSVLRSGGSVLDFLDSRYTFVNERLARMYEIGGVKGDAMRRVDLAEGSPRGGVVTMGAVLTVTSNTTRTSPVKRGLYVLDQILGSPPPPPPPGIPPLEEAATAHPGSSLREQLKAHVANPSCAACHERLDPLGLALENFNAVGAWRDLDGVEPIDARGELPGGVVVDGPRELKKLLMERADRFIETLSGKLLMYAIGRGLEDFDKPAVRRIASETRGRGNRLDAMIEAIVLSDTFRTCRAKEATR